MHRPLKKKHLGKYAANIHTNQVPCGKVFPLCSYTYFIVLKTLNLLQ